MKGKLSNPLKISSFSTAKSFLSIFLPFTALIIGVTMVHYYTQVRSERTIIESRENNVVTLADKVISSEFDAIVSDLMILAENKQLQAFLETGRVALLGDLAEEFLLYSEKKKLYDQIRFLDETGMEIVRVNFNYGDPGIIPENMLRNKGKRYYFKDTIQLEKEEVFVSPFDLNIERGEIEQPLKPIIRFGTPVFDITGRKRGIVLLNYLGVKLIDELEKLTAGASGQILLLNTDGFWLKGPRPEDEWGFMYDDKSNRRFGNDLPGVWEKISKADLGQFRSAEGKFTFATIYPLTEAQKSSTSSGRAFEPSAKRISDKDYYWKIVSHVSIDLLNAVPRKTLRRLFLLNVFAIVLLATISGLLSRANKHREQAEKSLRENEELMRLVIDTSPALIYVKDRDGKFVLINKKGAEFHGKTPETMAGRNERDFTYISTKKIDEINKFLADDRQIIDSQVPKFIPEEPLTLPDGKTRWLQTTKIPITINGVQAYVLGVSVDITERKRAEEGLQNERNLLRTLIDNIPDLIYVKDNEGRFVIANNSVANHILVNTRDKLIGKTDFDFYPKELAEKYFTDEQAVIQTGQAIIQHEEPSIDSSGKPIWLSTTKVPFKDTDGKIIGIIGIGLFITERKRLEEQLQIRQRMDSLGTLAGGIAHDFNNLLTGIMGYIDLMNLHSENLTETQKTYISNALKSSQRAADLISQLQTLSRGVVTKKTSVDVYEIISEVFQMLEKTTDRLIKKEVKLKPGKYYITANASELNQVFLNLGTNAVQSFEEKGTKPGDYIRVSAKDYEVSGAEIKGLLEGKYIHITFEDNGCGMSGRVRKKAFDPLFTTKDKGGKRGQGLGLAMVFNIVTRRHGGYIDIESKVGKGTAFHIYLPKSKPEEDVKVSASIKGGNETVLIIEDEEQVSGLAESLLKSYGYKVLTAADGKHGLDTYEKNKGSVDLILLDLTMPTMSGRMVFEKMLEVNPNIKVIICSGQSDEDIREGILSQAQGILKKPYRVNNLARSVREVLDS